MRIFGEKKVSRNRVLIPTVIVFRQVSCSSSLSCERELVFFIQFRICLLTVRSKLTPHYFLHGYNSAILILQRLHHPFPQSLYPIPHPHTIILRISFRPVLCLHTVRRSR